MQEEAAARQVEHKEAFDKFRSQHQKSMAMSKTREQQLQARIDEADANLQALKDALQVCVCVSVWKISLTVLQGCI